MSMAYVIDDGSALCCFCTTERSGVVIGRRLLERRSTSVTSVRLSEDDQKYVEDAKKNFETTWQSHFLYSNSSLATIQRCSLSSPNATGRLHYYMTSDIVNCTMYSTGSLQRLASPSTPSQNKTL